MKALLDEIARNFIGLFLVILGVACLVYSVHVAVLQKAGEGLIAAAMIALHISRPSADPAASPK